jgi:hypothetical protein
MSKLTNAETADALAKLAEKYRQTEGEIATVRITLHAWFRADAIRIMQALGGRWRLDPVAAQDDYYQRLNSEEFELVSVVVAKTDLGTKTITWKLEPLVDDDGMPIVEKEDSVASS